MTEHKTAESRAREIVRQLPCPKLITRASDEGGVRFLDVTDECAAIIAAAITAAEREAFMEATQMAANEPPDVNAAHRLARALRKRAEALVKEGE